MKDVNEFKFSGTVERFDRINTKTGSPMIAFTVMCWKERIWAVAFKDLAERTELAGGDRIEVRGHIQTSQWTDKEGRQRTGWQVIAHDISRAVNERQEVPRPPAPKNAHCAPLDQSAGQERDCGDNHAYRGGPF